MEYDVQHGTVLSNTATNTQSWGNSVTASAKLGFAADIFSGGVSVSGTQSNTIGDSYSSFFQMSTTITSKFQFPAGKTVWQWKFKVNDGCGTSETMGLDFQTSPNAANPPCCLPAFFNDSSAPGGEKVCAPGGYIGGESCDSNEVLNTHTNATYEYTYKNASHNNMVFTSGVAHSVHPLNN